MLAAVIDRVFAFCASLKLAVLSLLGLALVLAVATFYEASFGTDAAQLMIYQSWWFAAMLGALAINIFAAAVIRFPWKRHQSGFVITHAGLLTLLLGCVVGFHRTVDGSMAIEEGKSARLIRLKQEHLLLRYADDRHRAQSRIPVNLLTQGPYPTLPRYLLTPALGSAWPPMWPAGRELALAPSGEFVQAVGQDVAVEVLDWYPAAEAASRVEAVDTGAPRGGGGPGGPAIQVSLQEAAEQDAAHDHEHAPLAQLWLHLPLMDEPSDSPQTDEQRLGPMIVRLRQLADAAAVEEFFAYDAQVTLPLGALGLLEFALTPDGRLLGRRFSQRGLEWAGPVSVGQSYPAFMTVQFNVRRHLPHAVRRTVYERLDLPPDKPGIPAARLRVRVGAHTHEQWIARDGMPRAIPLGRGEAVMHLTYGIDHLPLDFAIQVDRFERGFDPGTTQAASFASHVQVVDERDRAARSVTISMNEPLEHSGFTFYQSGFQALPGGRMMTVLSVNRDPSRPIKYAGCGLIVAGIFTMFYMRAYFVKRPVPRGAANAAGQTAPRERAPSGSPVIASCVGLLLTLSMATSALAAPEAQAAAPPPRPRLHADTLDALRALPVLHDGRVKPLDTVARQTIRQVTGRTYFGAPEEAGSELKVRQRFDPVELLLACMSDPETWSNVRMIQIERLELRRFLNMPETHSHIAAHDLLHHAEYRRLARELFQAAAQAEQKGLRHTPTPFEAAVLDVSRREGHFRAACRGALLGVAPYPADEDFLQWLIQQERATRPAPAARAALVQWRQVRSDLEQPERLTLFAQQAGWLTLDALLETDPEDLPPAVAENWTRAGTLWAQALAAYAAGGDGADDAVRQLVRELAQATGAHPEPQAIDRELFYNRAHPFRWALALYGLAAVMFLVAVPTFRGRRALVYLTAIATLTLAILAHVAGFYLRTRISGWAPVTNMYETVVWVAMVCAIFGLVLELVYRWRVIGLAASVVALVCALVADIMPPSLGAELRNLQPVLRSNFWLSTHVLTIVSSYAAFALALGLGNIALGLWIFAPQRKAALGKVNLFTYRAVQVGVLLVAAGTILGGVWADKSWGRFWGWDPKEVWALIVLLVYLAILHGRHAGWVGQFGLAAGAVLGFMSVIMAWYGVNFVLGAGLHSYGFGAGGRAEVFTGVMLQCGFVALAWWRYRRATAPSPAAADQQVNQEVTPEPAGA